ncbi:MAG: ribonuclease J [Bacillales bacterium]|jgi:ribonuclease J|nr:ribonuclease J [Bacillales bacterium]
MIENSINKISSETLVFALGGLGEVGKNMYCVQYQDSLFIIDSGVRFPGVFLENMGKIDYIIPDFTYLKQNQSKIKALIITHGHEDHIGGIPFLLQQVYIPLIIAPRFASILIQEKLIDAKTTESPNFLEATADMAPIIFGEVKIDFIEMTHSTPDSFGVRFKTPNGTILTTGDFKVDLSPIGNDIELAKLARWGEEGITLLLADSTNAEQAGNSRSEKAVADELKILCRETKGRILIVTFASNVYRIQQIIQSAINSNRKIYVDGRSMEKTVAVARKMGYIKCPDSSLIDYSKLGAYPDNEILILCTGSQGEPAAALSRIASGEHKYIKIKYKDTVIFSSSPIPGNGLAINQMVNTLTKANADVLTSSSISNLHASGHAYQEELKLLLKLAKPKYFMPIHGEYRMLKLHERLANLVGVPKNNTFVCVNGDAVVLKDGNAYYEPEYVQPKPVDVYVDGKTIITEISKDVIEDRKKLGDDGVVGCVLVINASSNELILNPTLVQHGFIVTDNEIEILKYAQDLVTTRLRNALRGKTTFKQLKEVITTTLDDVFESKIKRKPIIVPVILDKNSKKIADLMGDIFI